MGAATRRISELRGFSATAFIRAAVGAFRGGPTFTAQVLMRYLGPASTIQHLAGNVTGASGWAMRRLADTGAGTLVNFQFVVYEAGVVQTLNVTNLESLYGKFISLTMRYDSNEIVAFINGVEIGAFTTAGNPFSLAAGRFSIGYDINAASSPAAEEALIGFAYTNVAETDNDIVQNHLELIKRQEVTNGTITWTDLYSVARDAGMGVPSTLRNNGTTTNALEVVGRASFTLGTPIAYLGDPTKQADGGGGGGDVSGPGASTDNSVARWDGATGTQIQNSGVIIDDAGDIDTPGLVDGRDVSVDGAKLDTIATGATNTPLSAVAPVNVNKSAALVGVAVTAARSDHKHDIDTATAVTITSATNSEGTATTLARSDHTHAHGDLLGGTLHAAATTSVAGFMSATDKTKLDSAFTGTNHTFTASGPWTCPAGITKVIITAAAGGGGGSGGGGGGTGATASTGGGGGGKGGGAGGCAWGFASFPIVVVPGQVYTVTIGAGGAGGAGGAAGGTGAAGSNGSPTKFSFSGTDIAVWGGDQNGVDNVVYGGGGGGGGIVSAAGANGTAAGGAGGATGGGAGFVGSNLAQGSAAGTNGGAGGGASAAGVNGGAQQYPTFRGIFRSTIFPTTIATSGTGGAATGTAGGGGGGGAGGNANLGLEVDSFPGALGAGTLIASTGGVGGNGGNGSAGSAGSASAGSSGTVGTAGTMGRAGGGGGGGGGGGAGVTAGGAGGAGTAGGAGGAGWMAISY